MYDRREQVQAHSFLVGRLDSAVLRSDPDAPDRPLRRTSAGVLGGIAVGGLVIAGVLVASLFTSGSGTKWREAGSLVVDGDTGNRYLLVDGRLRPVLNYASARLVLGAGMKVAKVRTKDLDGTPKGTPIGILGAPDAIPTAPAPQPWTVCAGTGEDGPLVSVTVGPAAGTAEVPADRALLVRVDGELHLAWRDRRFRVTAPWAPRALGLDPDSALDVDATWLNVLPAGPDLGAPQVRRGGRGPAVGGRPTTVGQFVSVPDAVGGGSFVVAPDGLVPVTGAVAALVAADPAAQGLPALRITPAELAEQTVLPAPAWQAELPPEPPSPVLAGDDVACVRWSDDTAALVVAPPPSGPGRGADPEGVTRDERVADRVEVAPGAGLLVRTRPAPGVAGASTYLVTETGAKFPVANDDAAAALGLPVDSAPAVPPDLLTLLPTGPVLDRIT
ncbi:type VII secretion protein EccB [Saccharothrix yanglingensis]|uniref:Type VII secretion protein EccB n=1 Tax=Saccharothrix yanglingensis TaxID=659496 RepID=A0ABU0XAC3_9PSEU|nr:type VII secretion protein EccB [Saccharothrix yanglingensis]MDQ2589055.1 type VII secretion protein EccB [Saccharothrix yanglingensis]